MIIIQRIEVIIIVFFAGLTKTKLLLAGSRPILQLTVTCQPNSYRQLPVKQQLSVAGQTAAVSCRSNSCCQFPVQQLLSVASQKAAVSSQSNNCCRWPVKQLLSVTGQLAATGCQPNSCRQLLVEQLVTGCQSDAMQPVAGRTILIVVGAVLRGLELDPGGHGLPPRQRGRGTLNNIHIWGQVQGHEEKVARGRGVV